MTSRIEAEGNSIDEAIEKALAELGVTREQVRVEILSDAKRGLLGFGAQKARVLVSLRSPGFDTDVEPATTAPTPEATRGVESTGNAAEILKQILLRMDIEGSVEAGESQPDGQTTLRIESPQSALVIGRHGQTLDALEYIVNRIIGKQEERGSRVVLDCERYRERHERELRDTAGRLAEKVRSRGKPQTMTPMSPRDRRIVHLTLSAQSDVVTRSVGQGYLRRVVIVPARAGARSGSRPDES